ncbi:MAG: hypothetical protein IIC80_05480 [Chloroflexi bacterium]|nr:hypothetical protein [Chloroflexota bacterium]MCH8284785.1 hypothetical protein [Chloroflexota bacterium]
MKVPAFLLKRLFVKGSLRNTSGGFEFKLKNQLGSGYAYGLLPLIVDGEEVPADRSTFSINGKTMTFTEVSKESPASLAMNKEATIAVEGQTLAPGAHKVKMGFIVTGLGELRFDLVDNVVDG